LSEAAVRGVVALHLGDPVDGAQAGGVDVLEPNTTTAKLGHDGTEVVDLPAHLRVCSREGRPLDANSENGPRPHRKRSPPGVAPRARDRASRRRTGAPGPGPGRAAGEPVSPPGRPDLLQPV